MAQTNAANRLRIYELPPFEKGVAIIKYYEKFHPKNRFPFIGYGHKVQAAERLTSDITHEQADSLLRSDLEELCGMFRGYQQDSLLLAVLVYNVGYGNVFGNGSTPKSRLIRKIESGNRNFQAEYLQFCHYKGKKVASIKRRRYTELRLLYCR